MEKSQLLKNSIRYKSKPSTFFSAHSIYFFKDTAPLPYQKSYVELLKGEGGGGRVKKSNIPSLSYFD